MKYFLLIAFMGCSYGQYPSLNYMNYYNNRYGHTKKDTTPIKIYIDLQLDSIILFDHNVDEETLAKWDAEDPGFYRQLDFNQFDSSKLYWQKELYWQRRLDKETERLNRTGHKNDISKALLKYQDSVVYYKILLDKLKK